MTTEPFSPEQRLRKRISTSRNYADLKERLAEHLNAVRRTTTFEYDKVFNPKYNPNWNKLLRLAVRKIRPESLTGRVLSCEAGSSHFTITVYAQD